MTIDNRILNFLDCILIGKMPSIFTGIKIEHFIFGNISPACATSDHLLRLDMEHALNCCMSPAISKRTSNNSAGNVNINICRHLSLNLSGKIKSVRFKTKVKN